MKRSIAFAGVSIMIAAILVLTNADAQAGRIGGPLTTVSTAPAGLSVYYDIPFAAGDIGEFGARNVGETDAVFLAGSDGDGFHDRG